MSEELIEQIKADERIRGLKLSRDELERLAELTEQLHRDCPLFRRLSIEDLAYIAQAGTVQTHERGEVLIREGDTDRVMYIVLAGQLRVWKRTEQGSKQLLGYHYPGDYSGEMIMLTGEARLATLDVVEDAKVLAFDETGWARIKAHEWLEKRIEREGPERVRENTYPFEGKQLDEVIVERRRKSWVALLRRILAPILITVLVLTAIALLSGSDRLTGEIATSIGLAVVVAMFLWGVWMWQDWRNDDYIVTSKRVIHVERILMPPFPIERREVAIQAIQDIRISNQGLWTLLFGVQSIVIRTMGEVAVRFPDMDNAEEIKNKIFETQRRGALRSEIPGQMLIQQRLREELGMEVKQVTPLDSGLQMRDESTKKRWLGPLDYFVPYTRIEEPDKITWRQHWLFMLRAVLAPVLLGFLSLVLVIWPLVSKVAWVQLQRWVWVVPGLVLLLVSFGWYLWRYEGWRNNIYQVTDSRIVDIDGTPFHLRHETRTEGTFDVIQNVTYDSPNWLFRLLSIGFVTIDTAAEHAAYTFDWVSHPAEVQQEIFRRWTDYRVREEEAATRRRHQEFLDWIVQYHQLVNQKG